MESRRIETIERLGRLLDEGKISVQEYRTLKGDVLRDTAGGETTTRPPDSSPTPNKFPDKYQEWLDSDEEPTTPGWYPDPNAEGTHIRFFDGRSWIDRTRKRKEPGWYPHPEHSDRERFFDGLEYTYDVRPIQGSTRPPATKKHQPRSWQDQTKDWRFWTGLVLVILGGLAAIGNLISFSNEPIQSVEVLLFRFAIHPLIWGGIAGTILLYRWRQAPS